MLGSGAARVPDVIPTHPRPTPTPGPGSGPCFSFGLSDLIAVSQFSSVQSLSRVRFFATSWTAAHQATLSITNSQNLLKLMSIESVMPPSHLILSSPSPSTFNISQHQVFSNESALRMRWPKYWSFSSSIRHSNEHPGLISFRMDWLDLLAVQGTFKSLLQHYSSKASILRHSALFIVQLWKNHSFD